MESSWFRKSIPNTKITKEETEFEALNGEKSSKLKTLNAFHIISLSEGFDLSPLFEEKKREEKGELRLPRRGRQATRKW
ncbi:hypothetical protein Gohar_009091, partial [Gossypium harknessii]|nr:hypothetical protein [Gossypium harknessii]